MKKIFFSVMVAVAMLAGTACSSTATEGDSTVKAETTETTETTTTPQVAGEDAEAVSTEQFAYICPMKCEGSASHQPGKCPECGMDLAENPDYKPADNTLK